MKSFLQAVLSAALLFTAIAGFGQTDHARRQMSLFKYSRAINGLERAYKSKDSLVRKEAAGLLAECYRMQNDVPKSLEWYEKSIAFANPAPLSYYYYAQALRSSGAYPLARKMFQTYSTLAPSDSRGRLYMAFCDSAMVWQSNTPGYETRDATSLNSTQSDFSPVFYKEGLMFASDRPNRGSEGTYKWTGNSYVGLFYAKCKTPGDYFGDMKKPALLKGLFNEGFHNGPITFDKDYRNVFVNLTTIYKTHEKQGPKRVRTHLLKIFYGTEKKGRFRSLKAFPLNSESYSVGHPALAPDGKTLFFISDMPGGAGGTDIWYCRIDGDTFGQPVNAGPVINTIGDEMFPFVASNGDLWFASTGHAGFGGLDIFVARKSGDGWQVPENPGLPLNSSYDDFAVAVWKDNLTGLFSSNRPGGMGGDDIYSFRMLPKPVPPPKPAAFFVSGCVKDKTTQQAIPGAMLFLKDGTKGDVTVFQAGGDGCFRLEVQRGTAYTLKAMQSGYVADCLPFMLGIDEPVEENTVPRTLFLDQLIINKSFRIENIYYDFDKWNIREDAKPALDELVTVMKENPVDVELGSFTDCRGSDKYNLALSQKRAESAVEYIISRGISPSRITARGYGESQPVNKCTDCPKCTPAENQENRRTEFRVISTTAQTPPENFDTGKYKPGDVVNPEDLPPGFFGKCK
jgi:outer membrane protein OmpA-like peptidoglycan-associated protein/tetratricopeptide (TPR) repeat protein